MEFYIKNTDGSFELYAKEFEGWPVNGIWVIEDHRKSCIYELKDVPVQPTPMLASYMQFKHELEEHLSAEWSKKPLSVRDVAYIASEFFAMKAGAIKVLDEIIEG